MDTMLFFLPSKAEQTVMDIHWVTLYSSTPFTIVSFPFISHNSVRISNQTKAFQNPLIIMLDPTFAYP